MTSNIDLKSVLQNNPELRIERDNYDFIVTTKFGKIIDRKETLERYRNFDGRGKPAHLYFHVPLCSYICLYCNYIKTRYSGNDESILDRWAEALLAESKEYLRQIPWLREARIESLYFGGGTAALLRERHLEKLMAHVRDNYALANDCEITLEGNPDNFSKQEVDATVGLGFNRFSIGIQSLDDDVLKFIGRGHSAKAALHAVEALVKTGLPVNVDYIFGMPHQTVESVRKEVGTFIDMKTPQVSIYRLRNADRVSLGLDIAQRSKWNRPDVLSEIDRHGLFPALDDIYLMRETLMELLLENGYRPAPAAWWSRAGVYPKGITKTSLNKWQNMDTMIAFGPGAYGWLTGGRSDIIQTHNPTSLEAYLHCIETQKCIPLSHGRYIEGREAVATALGFAFKAHKKIEAQKVRERFHVDVLQEEPYREVLFSLVEKGFLSFSSEDSSFVPTLIGEAFHEEIVSLYFCEWLGSLSPPRFHQLCP